MLTILRRRAAAMLLAAAVVWPGAASAWEMVGTKQLALRTREGRSIPIGSVTFTPKDGITFYAIELDTTTLKDFFLSMREFKCIEGDDVQCYVPYPYANPKTVTADDLTWLEHGLIFFYKNPQDFGAVLRNGLYYRLRLNEDGLEGAPQAIDLNAIASPPDDPGFAPFGPDERSEIDPKSRWIEALTIR